MASATITGSLDFSKSILRQLERYGELSPSIVIKGSYPARGIPVAQVAAWHEYGTSRMPSRPLLRHAARDPSIAATAADEAKAITGKNRQADTAAKHVAQAMATSVQRAIDESPGWAAPLAEATIEKKGHSHPLLDSGLLRKAVWWRVTRAGTIVAEGRAGLGE